MVKAECRIQMNNPFTILLDPTLTMPDAGHIAGSEPFQWPADVTQNNLNVLRTSNRLHSDYDVEIPDGFTLLAFEILATQDGEELSFVSIPPGKQCCVCVCVCVCW